MPIQEEVLRQENSVKYLNGIELLYIYTYSTKYMMLHASSKARKEKNSTFIEETLQ